MHKGISLIEIIIVVAILGAISSIIFISSSNQIKYYNLQKTSEAVGSLLEKGHNRARISYNNVKHSVRIESTQAILFEGTSYSAGESSNETVTYDNGLTLASTTLNGGATTITFEKVTGATNQYGLLRFVINNASTSSSTVYIGETGIIQVQ